MRAPMVIRWPGEIRPGTVKNEIFASLDWLPTFVEHRRWSQGRWAEEADRGWPVSRDRQDDTRWRQPDRVPRGKFGEVGTRYLLLLFGQGPVGGPLQELEDVLRDGVRLAGGLYRRCAPLSLGPGRQHQTRSLRDFDRVRYKTYRHGRGPRWPVTAYVYDWNMLPIGQALWLKELETYIDFPPLQDPASYNLDQVIQQVRE